jgi:hypothetical protein
LPRQFFSDDVIEARVFFTLLLIVCFMAETSVQLQCCNAPSKRKSSTSSDVEGQPKKKRAPPRCTLCGQLGHQAKNKKYHPESPSLSQSANLNPSPSLSQNANPSPSPSSSPSPSLSLTPFQGLSSPQPKEENVGETKSLPIDKAKQLYDAIDTTPPVEIKEDDDCSGINDEANDEPSDEYENDTENEKGPSYYFCHIIILLLSKIVDSLSQTTYDTGFR